MRRIVILTLALLLPVAAAADVVVKGSDTVLPLSQKEAEVYLQKHKDATVSVIGGGSGVGIAGMLDGTCDIAQSSRQTKSSEKRQAKMKGLDMREHVVARDALTVVVHPENPVRRLTVKQIGDIFSGDITNWKDVGGPNQSIVVYSRESSSGTYEFFRTHVLDNREFAASALLAPATGAIVQSVSQTKGAIGYIGMAYLTEGVVALEVAKEAGAAFVPPNPETAVSGAYPISRDLYYYTNGEPKGDVKAFLDFVLSPEGQKIVEAVGFVPVRPASRS